MESYIMDTYKKFIKYYGPYKTVFFFDLLCAAFISIVDLAYPQILRTLTNTLFLKESSVILKNIFIIGGILPVFYIPVSYTHLDVYKRQCQFFCLCIILGLEISTEFMMGKSSLHPVFHLFVVNDPAFQFFIIESVVAVDLIFYRSLSNKRHI